MNGGDPTALIQFGVLGVILMLVLMGFLWAKPSVDRILEDKKKAEEQRDALLNVYQTQVIPVLNDVTNHVVPGMNKVLEKLESVDRAIQDIANETPRRAK